MATLLVIEDDLVSQKILKSLLEKRGHTVYLAATVAEALQELENHALIDIVVLDNQLQGEYGWEFLRNIRKDFVFKHIPVLVYSASSDRNSVLRYLQLGVQKILVKPYNGKKLEEEIQRAIDYDWRGMIFEPSDRVCQRLNISEEDYFKSLNSAAEDVLGIVPNLNRLIGRKDTREFDDHLSSLQSCAMNLGISILENATESIQSSLEQDKIEQGVYFINRLVPTARLMQHRSLAFFGMTNSEEIPDNILEESNKIAQPEKKNIPTEKKIPEQQPLDIILNSPIHAYHKDLQLFLKKNIFNNEEITASILEEDQDSPMHAMKESLSFITNFDSYSDEEIVEKLEKDQQLSSRLLTMLNLSFDEDKRHSNLLTVIKQMNKANIACLYTIFSWLKVARLTRNPINLEPLARRSIGVALISRELSLKFNHTDKFTIAGALHNITDWILALKHPGLYSIMLTISSKSPDSIDEAQQAIFGVQSPELAEQILNKWGIDNLFINTTKHHELPTNAPSGEARIISSITNLAYLLGDLNEIGFHNAIGQKNKDSFLNANAWDALKKENINIPLSPEEYLSALSSVIDRVKRQISGLFE